MPEQQAKTRVLIVDDHKGAREVLASILSPEGYELFQAGGGEEALRIAREITPDVILLDVMMPDIDGNEVCRAIRADPDLAPVPVIMVTGLNDKESRLQATWSGADDFLAKPVNPVEVRARVRNISRMNRYRLLLLERERVDRLIQLSPDGIVLTDGQGTVTLANPEAYRMLGLDPGRARLIGKALHRWVAKADRATFDAGLRDLVDGRRDRVFLEVALRPARKPVFPVEITVVLFPLEGGSGLEFAIRDVTERYEQLDTIRELNSELLTAYDTTLEGWVAALDLRHEETKGHTQRVTDMTMRFAAAAGSLDDDLEHVRRGALLHDIGKIALPDTILLKPGPLTKQEWDVMRRHPIDAYNWLSPIDFLRPALDIPHRHHEKWDGSGYPDGLAGEEIPLAARMFSLVDVWDALISDRAYRKGLPREEVFAYITSQSGKHFDPGLTPLFVEACTEFMDAESATQ